VEKREPRSRIETVADSGGTTVQRWVRSGMRLGVSCGTHTTSTVSGPICTEARAAITGRNSASMTLVKSRGANRSIGFSTSARAHRMSCFPMLRVNRPAVTLAARRLTDSSGARRPRSSQSTRTTSST
jgi:hypothetical protein